jgi:hypothetical protein
VQRKYVAGAFSARFARDRRVGLRQPLAGQRNTSVPAGCFSATEHADEFDTSGYPRVVLEALKKYGMILAHNAFRTVHGSDLEVVRMGTIVTP